MSARAHSHRLGEVVVAGRGKIKIIDYNSVQLIYSNLNSKRIKVYYLARMGGRERRKKDSE